MSKQQPQRRSVRRNSQRAMEASMSQEFGDGRSFDPAAVQLITQTWVDKHMKEQENKFTETVKAKMFCGTWNVNGKILEDGLLQWLCPPNSVFVDGNGAPNSDIYIVGFQEMVDLNVVNVASDSKSQQRSQYWQEKLAECLNSKGVKYTQILARHLVGLLLCVLVKDTALPYVRDVRGATAGVGVMGVMGNKGGVSVRFTLYDSSVCIVCSHLAAHRENVAGRNGDFQSILEKTIFLPSLGDGIAQGNFAPGETETREDKVRKLHYTTGLSPLEELTILDHDLVFWIGDLNYRIDESVSIDDVFAKVELKDWAYLRQFDQLNNERAKGNVFQNFSEGELCFGPTYKFQPGTGDYDRRPEKKVRAPAWCDRILWRGHTSLDAVNQLLYSRAELFPSDHLPVMALFICNIRKIVKEKETEVFQELMKELDKHENDSIPRVSIEGSMVNFSTLYFQEPLDAMIRIKNVGTSIAHWRFVPKLEEKWPCKKWISIDPTLGMLLPGEDVEVNLRATIDSETADALNCGREVLDDIMVLRVENGQDFFITVKGNYARSCFGISHEEELASPSIGMSLEQLVCALDPVRNIPPPALDPSQANDLNQEKSQSIQQLSIPKELWRLVDALWQGGMREKDLFTSSAEPGEVAKIRECLDTGVDFPPCSPHSIAEALILFISSLPQPLLPLELYPSASDVEPQNIRAWSRHFLEQLPPINYNVFVYLLSFQRELLSLREFNRLNAATLALMDVTCMTAKSVSLTELARESAFINDSPDDAPNLAGSSSQTPDAKTLTNQKELLQVVMNHFLTSAAI